MAEHVEARSLSLLNHLAANPPQYPVNPSGEKHEPLALYLSRVPGTRDVILSPAKPQLKNVTGEDVKNSLYYIHFDLPGESAEPPGTAQDSEPARRSQDSARAQIQIPRKPLPANSRAAPNTSHSPGTGTPSEPTILAPAPPEPTSSYPVTRVAPHVTFTQDLPSSSSPEPLDPPPPYPGSLSPERRQSDDKPALRPQLPLRPPPVADHDHDLRPELPPRPRSQNRPRPYSSGPAGPPRPPPHGSPLIRPASSSGDVGSHQPDRSRAATGVPPRDNNPRTPSPSKLASSYTPYVPFSLTIIRRDPSSGHQWNVGKVTSHQIETEEESGYIHQRPSYDSGPEPPPISIYIENSGYCKFRGIPSRRSLDGRPNQPSTAAAAAAAGPDTTGVFRREAVMTYSKGWRTNIREKLRRPDADGELHGRPSHRRGHSRDPSHDSTDSDGEQQPITQPGPGLRPQGYMFTSPWDGRCVFRTGNAGRSVICRHVPDAGSSSSRGGALHSSNPLVPASAERRMAQLGVYPAVSELRFNLPVADLLKSREEAAQQLHDHLARMVKGRQGGGDGYSSDEEYSVLPFDLGLGLGKEKAGGGRRGRRAKLGKLIIHDEGFKMLDLVVAANMGIWWGAWEKSFWA